MAAQQTGNGEFHQPDHPLGADHQGNRVPVRHGCRVVLHVSSLVVLGEFRHIRSVSGIRRDTRSKYTLTNINC